MSLELASDDLAAWLNTLAEVEQPTEERVPEKPREKSERAKAGARHRSLKYYHRAMQDPAKRQKFRDQSKARYRKNPERKRAYDQAYRAANRDAINARRRAKAALRRAEGQR